MRRLVGATLLVFVILAIASCGGTDAGTYESDLNDWVRAELEFDQKYVLSPDRVFSDIDFDALVKDATAQRVWLEKLTPPASVEAEHAALLSAYSKRVEMFSLFRRAAANPTPEMVAVLKAGPQVSIEDIHGLVDAVSAKLK